MIRYRRATGADVPVIDQLLRALAATDNSEIKGSEDNLHQHGFGAEPRFRVVLAFRDNEPIGLSLFFPEYSSWRGKLGIFVQDLFVKETARGTGVGKGLIKATLTEAADWAPEFVTLMVQHKNKSARDFYSAQGFHLREEADLLILEGGALRRMLG